MGKMFTFSTLDKLLIGSLMLKGRVFLIFVVVMMS